VAVWSPLPHMHSVSCHTGVHVPLLQELSFLQGKIPLIKYLFCEM